MSTGMFDGPPGDSMFDGMKRPECWFTENGEGIVWRPMYWPLSAMALNEQWEQETGNPLNLNAADYHKRSVTKWAHPSVKDLEHWPAELVSSTRKEGWIAFSTIELDVTP